MDGRCSVFLPHSSHALPAAGPSKLFVERAQRSCVDEGQVTVSNETSDGEQRCELVPSANENNDGTRCFVVEWNILEPKASDKEISLRLETLRSVELAVGLGEKGRKAFAVGALDGLHLKAAL